MKDNFNREIDYLRISLTERCNFKCIYCMPDGCELAPDILSELEYKNIIRSFRELGIKKVRFSGGEPLLSPYLENLISYSKELGIEDIALTSNGLGLSKRLENLKELGLKRVNISLDTLREERFNSITKSKAFHDVMKSIEMAERLEMELKINCVLIKGINEDEIVDLLEFTKNRNLEIRFIELMPIGQGKLYKGVTPKEVLETLPNLRFISRRTGNTEGYYQRDGYKGKISFINPLSCSFCDYCSRVRLTSRGTIKLCLHSKEEIDLKPFLGEIEGLKKYIEKIIIEKPEKHHMVEEGKSNSEKFMYQIGG
jgi:cyclic pyranopterin phosphate synthase